MARTLDVIIKEILGGALFQQAVLAQQVESLRDEVARLNALLNARQVASMGAAPIAWPREASVTTTQSPMTEEAG